MTFVDGSAGATVTLGNTANTDGKDDAAVELMKANGQLLGSKCPSCCKTLELSAARNGYGSNGENWGLVG